MPRWAALVWTDREPASVPDSAAEASSRAATWALHASKKMSATAQRPWVQAIKPIAEFVAFARAGVHGRARPFARSPLSDHPPIIVVTPEEATKCFAADSGDQLARVRTERHRVEQVT